ncbi:radical SAM/SPASM domain-containing protein [Paenibacillus durus]|uniref:Radical SAM core domain-containing protein n=1 Tax=Paenibacillus durus ATCC 35681 TaxID=1333534 RepID=A0A0F7CIU8_PAEDU|nr:radical SAM protein [Paenibacillus durus]AKG34960.1 hypothetical protein VK70_10605 [Paenibacillus durus ATCC 35681]
MLTEPYTLPRHCKVMHNENRTVLGNNKTGEWIKISEQCFNILNLGIENSLSPAQLIDCLEDEEDKLYFGELFEKLHSIDLIKENNESSNADQSFSHIYFALTNKCNLHCAHCCYNAEFTSTLSPKETLTTIEVIQIIDKILASKPEVITFSGGEPMLRDDFFEILKYTSQNFKGKINLATNATFINQNNVEDLVKYVGSFDISLDGVDEESCSQLRGRGVYGKVLNSIALLQEQGIEKISLSMVITDKNKHLEGEFRDLNKKLGTRVVVRQFNPIGRGKNLIKNSVHKEKTIERQLSNEKVKQIADQLKMCTCGAGGKTLLVDYDGSIYPCGLLISSEHKLAQIKELDHLNRLHEDATRETNTGFQSLINLQPDYYHKCKDCSVNLFCWHCLQETEMYAANDELFEERCVVQKKFLNRIIWDIEEVNV